MTDLWLIHCIWYRILIDQIRYTYFITKPVALVVVGGNPFIISGTSITLRFKVLRIWWFCVVTANTSGTIYKTILWLTYMHVSVHLYFNGKAQLVVNWPPIHLQVPHFGNSQSTRKDFPPFTTASFSVRWSDILSCITERILAMIQNNYTSFVLPKKGQPPVFLALSQKWFIFIKTSKVSSLVDIGLISKPACSQRSPQCSYQMCRAALRSQI